MFKIFHNTRFDFLSRSRIAYAVSGLIVVPALLWIAISGYNYSVEFTGGSLMQIQFAEPHDAAVVRGALASAGVDNVELQRFGSDRDLVIRAQGSDEVERQAEAAEAVVSSIRQALTDEYGADAFTVVRTEAVGPRVGGELRRNAIIALAVSFLITLIYLAWRFEWRFGVATLIATMADVIAAAALIKYVNMEVTLFLVGGLLTVLGYSMNDKIVVFDRVRENLKKHQKMPLVQLLNLSVNETLPRTVMTGTTTIATLFALLIFGGDVLRPFAILLIFGIVIGTFSSMFIGPGLLLQIERRWPGAISTKRSSSDVAATAASSRPAPPAAAAQRTGA